MTTHRCYAEPALWHENGITLPPDEAHHLGRVLRARAGDEVVVFDGEGCEAITRIVECGRTTVRLEVVELRHVEPPAVRITLVQSLPKPGKMDLIIEKATELGVHAIAPVTAERCVSRPRDGGHAARLGRWRRIAAAAAGQSGRSLVPIIEPVRPIGEFLAHSGRFDLLLAAIVSGSTVPLAQALAPHRGRRPLSVAAMIGPEGDFTPGEAELAARAGAVAVGLGRIVLRTETAAILLVGLLGYELGLLDSAPEGRHGRA